MTLDLAKALAERADYMTEMATWLEAQAPTLSVCLSGAKRVEEPLSCCEGQIWDPVKKDVATYSSMIGTDPTCG